MKVLYYPGCTLKTKARNLGDTAVESLALLDIELEELSRWNCCGAVHSLADDDLIHLVAPVRVLIRALEQGGGRLVTICSMCYNTLARANRVMRDDPEKRKTINLFMDEEPDYQGEVEVVHLLSMFRDEVGWDLLRERIKIPLKGLKIAPYYGCTLQRPREVGIEPVGRFDLMKHFIEALGAEAVSMTSADRCCGSYQILGNPEVAKDASSIILADAGKSGADALVLSCPLCEFNLDRNQGVLFEEGRISKVVPAFYFTQLLALALGVDPRRCHLELNSEASIGLLRDKGIIAS
ncbi:MAG: CoB--CoM heterodisulfide reductase iron-sulfur subunit B family protein [Deltaproteobacteria bacterium]|nr:CoB--CoM heterodisulfide reductase iron-sulfur subunit B family protein [Deltaproteobacteria bacterium]